MKSFFSTCLCVLVLNFALAALLQAADESKPDARPAASPASPESAASNEQAEVVRSKAMGPDVKLANLFRYQPPPLPLAALPAVTPNQGEGASMRVLHLVKTPEGQEAKK